MSDSTEKKCPQCGQLLRFPEGIGGMLMACPSCGQKFHSDFKLSSGKRINAPVKKGALLKMFEMPYEMMSRIWRYFSS